MGPKKRWIVGSLTLVYLIGIFWIVDVKDVLNLLPKITPAALFQVTILAILANLFAWARSGSMLKAFHFSVGWRPLFLAFAAGNLTTLAFNVFGQSLSRAIVLQASGIPFGISVLATYVERILAAGILLIFSLVGAWILFSGLAIDFNQGIGDLVAAGFGIVVVTISVALIALRKHALTGSMAGLRLLLRLGPSTAWTMLGHAAGLGAYLILFEALDPTSISIKLISALAIVMLATSLPISFAGFGLRELSAAATLAFVGIPAETAVACSILVGIIYIAVAGLFGLAALPFASGKRALRSIDETSSDADVKVARSFVTDTLIIQCLSIACAVLIFFRVRAPATDQNVLININVADILIFVALTVVVLMVAAGRLRSLFPLHVSVALAVLTAAIAGGLLGSVIYGHLAGWALYTRGVGWVVLLGYAALGAATTRLAGDTGRTDVANSLMVAAVTICGLQLVTLAVSFLHPLPTYVIFYPLQGFANNQNAFTFDLAISGVLLIAARHLGALHERQAVFICSIAVIFTTIFLTESRTGILFLIVLAAMDFAHSRISPVRAPTTSPAITMAVAAVFVALTFVIPVSSQTASHVPVLSRQSSALVLSQNNPAAPPAVETTRLNHPHADQERWDTILGGLQAWKNHPLFGAGIGAYFESIRRLGDVPKGIHSIYIWFLSEMGIVGLLALLTSAAILTYSGWTAIATLESRWGFTALGSLVLMGIGGLAQDFSYQRIFWFVLGLSLATPSQQGRSNLSDRVFVGAVVLFSVLLLIISTRSN